MKTYYNGPRKGMMYGGGATMRKPMMYGGMAKKSKNMQMGGMMDEKNVKPNQSGMMQATMPKNMMNPMGMMYGGQAKLDMNKNNKIDKEDFKMMRKKK
jgi:hypothetical protein